MTATTSVPSVQFTPTGLVVPTESAILAGVGTDQNAAFGGNMNPALNTPQGQVASSTTAIIAGSNAIFAQIVAQVNPNTSSGFMQDAIAQLYFLKRSPGAPTAVSCTCVGASGTVIPVNAQAKDTSGNLYLCVDGGTIPIGGSITLSFANSVDGPIGCPANTLTIIQQAISGWESINNPTSGVPGQLVESSAAFEFRRAQSVALNAHGSLDSIYAAVFQVANVIDVYATENTTNFTVDTGATAYPLVPHSLYVAVVGGIAADIAQAIWTKKDVGCDYNGNTTVVVTDMIGYSSPFPTYTVKFEIPASLPILFAVQIANTTGLPSSIVALTKAAIIAAFNGTDGNLRVRTGSIILAAKFYAGIIAIGPQVEVLSVLLGPISATLTSFLAGIDQAPTITSSNITVSLI